MRRFNADDGVYSILYALLVVVLFGMAAMVVDLGSLRADKRDSRSAADMAAVAGAAELGAGPYAPMKACDTAWTYALQSLQLTSPASPCAGFPLTVATCPNPATSTVVTATANGVTIAATWPIPDNSTALTQPDGLGTGTRTTDSSQGGWDGPDPCQRMAITVTRVRPLGLAAVLGTTSGTSWAQSVARYTTFPGLPGPVAALNVLDTSGCQTLSTGGQGFIVVNRSLPDSTGLVTPGGIAVESTGTTSGCGSNNKFVIDVSNNPNNRICASSVSQVPDAQGTCDGFGIIKSHALDSSATAGAAYVGAPGAVTTGYPLSPTPIHENGYFGWNPVTSKYGCSALPTTSVNAACSSDPPYMASLYSHLDSSSPTPYAGTTPFTGATYGGFTTLTDGTALAPLGGLGTFKCKGQNAANDAYYVPAGAWYVSCPDSGNSSGFQVGTTAIFGGGQIVFAGGVQVAKNSACLSINTPLTSLPATPGALTCPTPVNASTDAATTNPAPTQEAIVFIRGSQGFSNGSSFTSVLLPQTLVAQSPGGLLNLGGGQGTLLWTAPGAGPSTAGSTLLEAQCTTGSTLDEKCMASHFSKTAYWNETATSGTGTVGIAGQGSMTLVGTFFIPRAAFVFTGQSQFSATNAQIWVDTFTLSGKGGIGLTPDPGLSFPPPDHSAALIR